MYIKPWLMTLFFMLALGLLLAPAGGQARERGLREQEPYPWKTGEHAEANLPLGPAPVWKGITPGVSTLAQVEAVLGKPQFTGQDPGGKLYAWRVRDWVKRNLLLRNSVVVKDGVVSLIQVSDTDDFVTNPAEIQKKYGQPALVKVSQFSDDARYVAYPQAGRAFLVDNTKHKKPTAVFTLLFKPMAVEEFRAKFNWR